MQDRGLIRPWRQCAARLLANGRPARRLLTACIVALCGLASFPAVALGQNALDSTFGTAGKVAMDFGGFAAAATSVALQPDGRIVAAGWTQATSSLASRDFALARFNSDGTLDASFGINGRATTDFLGVANQINAIALQADGKIVAVGGFPRDRATQISEYGYGFQIARYLANGQLDVTFGSGRVTTMTTTRVRADVFAASCAESLTEATAVAIQADGRIVVGGRAWDLLSPYGSLADIAIARYNVDGSLDITLEGDRGSAVTCSPTPGVRAVNLGGDFNGVPSVDDNPTSVLLLPDGKITVGGYTRGFGLGQGEGFDGFLLRLQPNGVPDPTFVDEDFGTYFGTGLVASESFGPVYAHVLEPNGKVARLESSTGCRRPSCDEQGRDRHSQMGASGPLVRVASCVRQILQVNGPRRRS